MSSISSGTTLTTALVQTADTSGVLQLQTNGTTTAVTIDTNQNVGVGVTPSAWTSAFKALQVGAKGSLAYYNGTTYLSENFYNDGTSAKYLTTDYASQYNQTGGQHQWFTAPSSTAGNAITFTQAMTLDASGNLLVGQTTQSYSTVGFSVLGSGSGANGTVNSCLSTSTNATSSYNLYSTGAGAFRFYVTMDGTIHAAITSISAISDQTLKTNIRDLDTGLSEIMALQPRRFDWLNGDGTNVAGFISQEVQTVLPDLVNSAKYSIDENGETVNKLFLKMGDMIPTMVKAIQELSAQVTTLQSQVTALESK